MQSSTQQTPQQLQLQMQQRQQQQPSQQQQETVQPAQQTSAQPGQSQNVTQSLQTSVSQQSVSASGPGPNVNSRIAAGDGSIQSVSQSSVVTAGTVPSGSSSGPTPQQPPSNQFNTASLCKLGQDTVQEIVSKIQDTFQILRSIMPPSGTSGGANVSNEKRMKLQEYLRNIRTLFKRLRIIYEKCNDNSQLQGMEYMHIESLIPLKEEWDVKTSEERKTSEAYRFASEECKELIDQVVMKNSQLKEIIDHLRRIVWEINTMLTMRKS